MKTITLSSQIVIEIVVFLSFTTGCSKLGNDPYLSANEVWFQNFMFAPSTITVSTQTAVKWTNKDAHPHTVSSDDGTFGSGNIPPDSSFTYIFILVGIYSYHCKYHPMEKGVIIVRQ